MPAAIGMATEGIRAKCNEGTVGAGFGPADYEIGAKLDGARVLAAVERITILGEGSELRNQELPIHFFIKSRYLV